MRNVSPGIIIHRVTAKRSCFRSFRNSRIVLSTIYHLGGRCRCQFSVPTTRLFRFVRHTATFFLSTSFGKRKEERGKRQKAYMWKIVCTLMRSVTYGIDAPRKRTKCLTISWTEITVRHWLYLRDIHDLYHMRCFAMQFHNAIIRAALNLAC